MALSTASLLDEGTAAAEAMAVCFDAGGRTRGRFVVANDCHPQTVDVVKTRAEPLGIEVVVADPSALPLDASVCGVLLQYPNTCGQIVDLEGLCARVHAQGAMVVVACDLLALTLLRPPGEFGADIAVGNTQRFGVPMGYGGPHAAFFATSDAQRRRIPGRIVGLSKDANGRPALRLALPTREPHIRRETAPSHICTSQVLLAIIASMYAVYHGPEGLKAIALRVQRAAGALASGLRQLGFELAPGPSFDTVTALVSPEAQRAIVDRALAAGINLRIHADGRLGIALDEVTQAADLVDIWAAFAGGATGLDPEALAQAAPQGFEGPLGRKSAFLTHPVFKVHRSETELLRYIHRLQKRDLSLTTSMIPLGSCTMKLNATAEMMPITLPGFGALHPFAPRDQAEGYTELFRQLEAALAEITGFSAISLQPNAGSQGEYAGLLVIRAWHLSRGQKGRRVCLIPTSAHGTNPASAVMAGMDVVTVRCDSEGNIDLDDLKARASQHAEALACLMVTYPSTHGVFEEDFRSICEIIHAHGGQVYLDGANLNALVGLCRPGEIGADVCHLNLHKTMCIPPGGGGPGMGPIGVAPHLVPFLPAHGVVEISDSGQAIGPVSAAPWGSPSILPISWAYIRMMGGEGLTRATKVAILNANAIANRLGAHYPVLYKGRAGRGAHECILALRDRTRDTNVTVTDVAKRLMDFGFHAPTVSWPVAGTMMIEPTESESLAEIDRVCEAMIAIRAEIQAIADGRLDREDNPLRNAPHTAEAVTAEVWTHPYSRQQAAFPLPWVAENKFWPAVGRVDDAFGDRNLVCACPPIEDYARD